VVDDYGHHPTEISATLAAAKAVRSDGERSSFFSRTVTRERTN
jgi:UDP-N-acetylmuramate-alanine ligase